MPDDDGRITMDRTRLPGMVYFLVVHRTHMTIMNEKYLHKRIVHILENESFNYSRPQ